METLRYCKTRNVKDPVRAHSTDAGIDFYVPLDIDVDTFIEKCNTTNCSLDYSLTDDYCIKAIYLKPGQSILIPSGIHVKIPNGYAMIYMNKSGIASKRHLLVGACVVDQDYEGECHINLFNAGDSTITIEAGDKIVQGVVIPVNYCQTEECASIGDLYAGSNSDRGAGGFGSSGVK